MNHKRQLLKNFETKTMEPFRRKIKECLKSPKDNMKKNILEAFDTFVSTRLERLLGEKKLSAKKTEKFFTEVTDKSKETMESIKANRSIGTVFLDFIKDVANFCIKLLTLGKEPHFFTTSTTPVETVVDDIKKIEKQFETFIDHYDYGSDYDTNYGSDYSSGQSYGGKSY